MSSRRFDQPLWIDLGRGARFYFCTALLVLLAMMAVAITDIDFPFQLILFVLVLLSAYPLVRGEQAGCRLFIDHHGALYLVCESGDRDELAPVGNLVSLCGLVFFRASNAHGRRLNFVLDAGKLNETSRRRIAVALKFGRTVT